MMFENSRELVLQSYQNSNLEEDGRHSGYLATPPDNFTPENLLAEELKKLSYDDRLEIEEELHGVGCRATNETPHLIELSLSLFDEQVNIRKENDPSCMNVLRNVVRCWLPQKLNGSNPSNCYLNETSVRLRFLRCERFDVEKAVQRFIDCLTFMSHLFGDFIAVRPIRLSDFRKEEESSVMQSRNQFLPYRDRSGRRVLIGVGNCNFNMTVILRYKILMYLFWVVSEDVETQIKGIVILCWAFDEKNDSTWQKKLQAGMPQHLKDYQQRMKKGLPVRVASWQHYYRDTPYFRLLANLYIFSTILNSSNRSIFKVHFGSEIELKYKLASYGVPVELLPMSSTGTLKFENHRDWLNVIRLKANFNGRHNEEIVECPRFNDVVYRKGPASKLNAGNAYYRELIEDHSLDHFMGDRKTKHAITKAIMEKVQSRGGRFLEWKNMWVVYKDPEEVRKKIASAFKQFNRSRKKGDSELLFKSIKLATSLGNPEKTNPFNSANASLEYSFVANPAKRLRIKEKDDDSACFGNMFFST